MEVHVYTWIQYINWAAMFLSSILLIYHNYKFFLNTSSHTITKTVTLYFCFIMYIGLQSNFTGFKSLNVAYFSFTVTACKIIAAVEILLCFRRAALDLQPTDRQHVKFFVYFLICFAITIGAFFLFSSISPLIQDISLELIYLATLVPIFVTCSYLRSPKVKKPEFALHKRLLFAIFLYAILLIIVQLFVTFGTLDFIFENKTFQQRDIIVSLSISLEAFLIAIFFTFREDTFLPVTSDEANQTPLT